MRRADPRRGDVPHGRLGWALLATAVGLLLPLQALHAAHARQAADPTAVWGEFISALNQGDTATAITFFTEDGVFQQSSGPCSSPCVGRSAILPALTQLVAGQPVFTTLPDVQIADTMVSGHLRTASKTAGATVQPFTMAVFGDTMAALRLDAPVTTELMSAGTGGLIGFSSGDTNLIALLLVAGTLLGASGLLLAGFSLRRPARLVSTVTSAPSERQPAVVIWPRPEPTPGLRR
ncbi:MAG: nuclear transport factor 2 family protein, partial [Dehalococcoidia bacterium]